MSPKSPRNVSGQDLIKVLFKYGYGITRQKGSHIRLARSTVNGTHHVTVPNHDPMKLGTLSTIISDVADHLKIGREEILNRL